ncbi:MAG: methyltransferase domain-containing protein [Candidatus Promineifilaceae bacterium]|nr:methyltransferase domain-containing protein [Candidatus Promineifilaceae bacterium]
MVNGEYTSLKRKLIDIYRARAKRYDFTANLYYLIGYPEWRYRRLAVNSLDLRRGDTVVELGCGTGLNFGLLQERIGPTGQLIGVDLTDAMLAQAHRRVVDNGWSNVELVRGDALAYHYPARLDGVLSTYALSLIPACDVVIRRAARALDPGGTLALLELQIPAGWPDWLVKSAAAILQPFAVTEEWLARQPWHIIKRTMRETLVEVRVEPRYFATTYVISGRQAAG